MSSSTSIRDSDKGGPGFRIFVGRSNLPPIPEDTTATFHIAGSGQPLLPIPEATTAIEHANPHTLAVQTRLQGTRTPVSDSSDPASPASPETPTPIAGNDDEEKKDGTEGKRVRFDESANRSSSLSNPSVSATPESVALLPQIGSAPPPAAHTDHAFHPIVARANRPETCCKTIKHALNHPVATVLFVAAAVFSSYALFSGAFGAGTLTKLGLGLTLTASSIKAGINIGRACCNPFANVR